jgi:hypothetical protein
MLELQTSEDRDQIDAGFIVVKPLGNAVRFGFLHTA